jgi:uncharacterized membrane protein
MGGSGLMGGGDQLFIFSGLGAVLGRAWGSVLLRPYVFGFLAVYLAAAAAAWGWRRAAAFTVWAGSLAFAAEWSSTRTGIPFGLYHYTGATVGRELYLSNVPFFDPVSFTFLAYGSLGLAGQLLGAGEEAAQARTGARLRLAGLAGLLMMWLDIVIDPLAVRGDRWFLGRIFYYPEPGWYFGVPLANFVGWCSSTAIAWGGRSSVLVSAARAWERWPGTDVRPWRSTISSGLQPGDPAVAERASRRGSPSRAAGGGCSMLSTIAGAGGPDTGACREARVSSGGQSP